MQFEYASTVQDVLGAVSGWVAKQQKAGRVEAFVKERWVDFQRLELLGTDPDTLVDRIVGLMEAVRAGMPGPVHEAQMALLADGSGRTKLLLAKGGVVSSALPGGAGPQLVGWGGVADLVIDQTNGDVLAESPLPLGQFAYPVPHGWTSRTAATVNDPLAAERWLYGAALLSGVAEGAMDLTVAHVRTREQFGAPLATYQAIQFPLAECKVLVDGAKLAAIDAATRMRRDATVGPVAAAMAWLAAARVAERVTRVCHQSFGSLGFCNEAGLVEYTWALSWLRLGIGKQSAQRYLAARRRHGHALSAASAPGCLVLEGFS